MQYVAERHDLTSSLTWATLILAAHGLLLALILRQTTQPPELLAPPVLQGSIVVAEPVIQPEPVAPPPPEPPKPLPQKPQPVVEKPKPKPKPKPEPIMQAPPVPTTPVQAAAPAPTPPAEPKPAPAPPAPAPISEPRVDASQKNNPAPVYPLLSRRFKEQGKVVLELRVEADGSVSELRVKTSSGYPRLDKAALDAVKRWRFIPAKQGGVPIAYWYTQPIVFSLEGVS